MAIDTKPFVELAERHGGAIGLKNSETFYMPGAILYLAGALDAAQKRLDEYKAEIERLRVEAGIMLLRLQEARAFNAPLIRDWDNEAEDEAWKGLGNA